MICFVARHESINSSSGAGSIGPSGHESSMPFSALPLGGITRWPARPSRLEPPNWERQLVRRCTRRASSSHPWIRSSVRGRILHATTGFCSINSGAAAAITPKCFHSMSPGPATGMLSPTGSDLVPALNPFGRQRSLESSSPYCEGMSGAGQRPCHHRVAIRH